MLRYGEERVITVTPVAHGLLVPMFATVTSVVVVEYAAAHLHFVHSVRSWLLLVLAGPCLIVVATRMWRWRSHKVRVTSQRIIIEGGVLHHHRSEVDLRDVVATRVGQRLHERMTRRGVVLLETRSGTVNLGFVHHPSALCRIIDQERMAFAGDRLDFDTVFDFDPPRPHDFDMTPRRRRERRRTDW